ncbi:MAG: hypothetical protein RL367_762 [Pseudomonadota bacterium]|jgi:hypothetical protein
MAPAFLIMAATVAGFSYNVLTLSDRTKHVQMSDSHQTWKEHVTAIEAAHSRDATFSRYMRQQAIRLRNEHYGGGVLDERKSFATSNDGGWLDISETVTAASPDIISVRIEADSYEAGAPHPVVESQASINWSRLMQRPLEQSDVFEVPPDLALQRIALAHFSNRDSVASDGKSSGLPLDWHSASIGPNGITWFFGPDELGGYLSGGEAEVSWSALTPYLRHKLPFAVAAIRAAPIR